MKRNRRITALFISCMLFFTVPLRAAVADGIPEDAAVLTEQDESWVTDSSNGSELTEDVVEFDRTTQAVDSKDSAQVDSDEKSDRQEQQEIVEEVVPGETPGETDSNEGAYEAVSGDTEQGEGTDNPAEEGRDTGADKDTSGTCGEELYWKYSEGILSIIGIGEMYDYSYAQEAVPGWSVFSDLVEEIHIEEGVTMLDLDAFTGFTALKVICFNGSADAWASVMLTGEEVLSEENIFNSTEIRFAEQEGTSEENVGTEEGADGSNQDPEAVQFEENEAQDPADEQPEENEALDPAEGQPEETEAQDPADEQPEETEAQDPAEGQPEEDEVQDPADAQPEENIPEEPADEEHPADEAPAEEAGIAGTEEQAAIDAEDQENPKEAIADGQSEEPAVEEEKEEPSSEEKKEEPAAEEPAVADGEQPSSGAKETVPDVLTEQGEEEKAADDAAGASQETPLAITEQPEDAEAPVGQTVSFHVGANRTDASYQWQFSTNGTTWKICTSAGSNTDTFSFLMKDTLNGRMYRCAVTAGGTTLISDAAAISLKQEQQEGTLSITAQPEDAEVSVGQTVSFHVGANRTDASYQWQFSTNGTTWKICTSAGSNTDTFSFLMKDTLDGRKYRCAVTADGTTIISGEATVRLPQQQGDLTITQQPQDVEAAVGETVSLHVGANMADASFQWQFSTNGTTWKACTSAGSNTDTFSFLMKDTLDGRKYRCAVTGGGKTIISEEATVRLPQQQGGLSITQQPQDVEAAAGQTVSLHVGANMTDAAYQWQFSTNGTMWKVCTSAGSNTDTFSFLMKETLDGRKYRCAVTSGGKNLTSAVATVSLTQQQEPLAITVQPEDVVAAEGESVNIHVEVNRTDASYQWQFSTNGTTWKACTSAGCNTDTFSFLMKETLDGRKYRCSVSAGGRSVISKTATITVDSSQIIIREQPKSVFAVENDIVTLTVKANASDYRWQYYNSSWNDVNFTGQGTDTLQFRFTPDLAAEALSWEEQMPALWRCVVCDNQGNSEISDAAFVLPAPYFDVQPEDQSGNIGDTVVFNASVNGQYSSWDWEYSDNGGLSWQHLSDAEGSEDSLSVFYGIDNRSWLYRASIIDNFGNIYNSRMACIRASDDIFIYSQPVDQTADVGETISFFLIARYVDTYQWQISDDNGVSWENIENLGANTDTLTLSVEEKLYDSLYRCVVSDNQKSIVSNTVRILQPEFAESNEADFNWSDTDNNIFINGIHVDDTVILTGFTDTSQWSWNTQDMVVVDDDGVTVTFPEGESNDVLQIIEISQVKSGDNIHYIFKLKGNRVGRALLQGDNGDTTVSYLIEVYGDTPVIVTQPEDQSGEVGDTIQFSVDAIGATSYKWTHNGFSDGDDNTESAYSAVITSGSYHKDYFSGAKYQCEITGCGGAVVKTNIVYVYRPSECWIEGDEITVEIGDEYKIICHSYSCSDCRLEYSSDGEIWYQAVSCGNRLQSSGSYTYTYEQTMTNYQNSHQYNLMYRWIGTGLDGEEVISNIIRVLEPQPVAILKQPEDQYARVDEIAHFEIEAENAASYNWQVSYDGGNKWYYLNYGSEDTSSPVFDVYAADYKYKYLWRCIVTGVSGYQLESQAVTIKYPNGYFIKNPTDQIVSAGEYATFSVQAFEADSYQWQSRPLGSTWSNISNATTDTYTVKVTTTMLAGMEYRCIMKDKDGKTTASLPARVIEKLKLTGQPKDQKLPVGDTATFTVEAAGVRQWQWYVSKDGGDSWEKADGIGENSSQLCFTIEPNHYEWIWRCDMIGDGQRLYSNNVRLYPITVITRQPHNMEASLGQIVGFDLAAENASNYQWQVSTDSGKSWSRASGSSTGSYYSYTIVSDKDYEKRWQCVLSDTSGNELVSDKVCVVEPSVRPVIHKQPHSVYSEADTTTTFSVTATGVKKYQWQKSYDGGSTWEEVPGNEAKTDKLSIIVTETMWDTMQWRCLLTGSGGTTVATNAVYVYEPVVITDEPNDAKGRVGQLVTFDVHANGQAQYQWQQSNDNGISWTECSGSYENGRALDISVEKEHFTKCCWRCLVSGPLGDQIFSKIVHVSRAEVAITDITLNMQTIKIKPGKTQQLAAYIEPLDATDQRLQWYSDNVKIATVNDNGLVTAVSKGSTQIRVCAGGRVSCCNITVADDFSIELTEVNSEIWTNDDINTSILVKLDGASMPCKINARFITKTGEPYRDSGTKTVNESEWAWAYEPISKPGIYNIVVSVTDAENRTVTVRSGDISVKRKPVYRALMIYQNDWNTKVKKLKKAPFQAWFKNDAYYMRDLLLQNTYEGGAKYTVKLSKNKKKSAIKAKIKSTFKGVKDGDVSLIHIGCHGNSKGGGDLFVPGATNATDFYYRMKTPGNIYRITPKELKKWIKDYIPKGKVVIILHSCGSGAMVHPYINESKNAEYMDTVSDAFISEFREADRAERSLDRTGELKNSRYYVLTSSAKKEVGAGWADRGCWLAYWLSSAAGYIRSDNAPTVLPARGIPLADTDGNGSVTISEAYSYVRKKSLDYGDIYKWSNGKPAITNPKAYWSDSQFELFHYSN